VPAEKVRLNLENFFIYAVFFMIFDVLGFVMVTTLARPSGILLPLFYAGASLVSVAILAVRGRSDEPGNVGEDSLALAHPLQRGRMQRLRH
jgi:hypothetical protein